MKWSERWWRLAVLVGSVALVAVPAVAQQSESNSDGKEETTESIVQMSCRDELGRPESWLDRSHSYLNRQLCEPAAWFDGFFGDSRAFEETPVGTFVRLRNSLQWDESEGWSVGVRVRANVLLPRVSERLRLLVTRDDDLAGEFQDGAGIDDADDQTRLGLRFIANESARSQLDLDGTVKVGSGGLNPRIRGRYRYVKGLSATTLARATQSVFWELDDGFGTTSRLDWEWLQNRDRLLRWTAQGTFSEDSEGVDWRTSVIDFHQLSPRTAIRAEVGAFGYTRPTFEVEEYFVAFRYRRQFLRRWLFFELQPEYAWPLHPRTGERGSDWRFTFTLEVQFENERSREERLRRYLGDEDEHAEDWVPELPVPVDAPGDRADDPVLEGNKESTVDDDDDSDAQDSDGDKVEEDGPP